MKRILIACCLVLLMIPMGCNAPKTVKLTPTLTTQHWPEQGTLQARIGDEILSMRKGDVFDAMELKNSIKGEPDMRHSCTFQPGMYTNIEKDQNNYYVIATDTFVYDSWGGGVSTIPCGIRINAQNTMDVEIFSDMRANGVGFIYHDLVGDVVPDIEMTKRLDTYSEKYLERSVKFESFKDGYLTLYVLEKQGQPGGYDAQGNRVGVKPVMNEQTLNFDLAQSRVIEIMGAKIEVADVTPDMISYTVLSPMTDQ